MPWDDSNPDMDQLQLAVACFASAVKQKVMFKAEQGYYGWNDPRFSAEIKKQLLYDATRMFQGDDNQFVDIAAAAMFLWFQKNKGGQNG